jgi:hypothetical protein
MERGVKSMRLVQSHDVLSSERIKFGVLSVLSVLFLLTIFKLVSAENAA